MFMMTKQVLSGGLYTIHGMLVTMEGAFSKYLTVFMPFIISAIQSNQYADDLAARFSCGLVSDLCANIDKDLAQYVNDLILSLTKILSSPETQSDTKFTSIVAIGDLLMQYPEQSAPHIELVMSTFETASKASVASTSDPEEAALFAKLRESIVDAYITILHGQNEQADGQNPVSQRFSLQMYKYLMTLVSSNEFSVVGQPMMQQIFDLYCDICQINLSAVSQVER